MLSRKSLWAVLAACIALVVVGCQPPPINPFLADSVVPIGHGNSAQTDSTTVRGPAGPTEALAGPDLTYQHIGPGHFGIAISPVYPDGKRVIWSNGGDRISKLDYDTLAVIDELPLPGKTLMEAATADTEIATLDSLTNTGQSGTLANTGLTMAVKYLLGLAGVYYLLDTNNVLFVGGSESIIAYGDIDPADRNSEIQQIGEWTRPEEIGGNFVGANITFDGRIAMVTNEGWIVLITRDFTEYDAIQLPGGDGAAAHNQAMLDAGFRPGSADWVRNSMAIDKDGGIYVPSFEHMHKVVWDGTDLSIDEADGAWHAPYSNTAGKGSGATPSLMGFGPNEDQMVVITDGDTVMNVELFWRNGIPEGWQTPAGALSNRTAGKARVDMGNPAIEAIQSEQAVVVGGYGAMVVNNEPASIPAGYPAAARTVLVGFAGADPAFTPHGMQKFEWNSVTRQLLEAWAAPNISSANSVPIVSTTSNLVYTVGARNGKWTMEAIDWQTGASAFHYETGSNRYNTLFSGVNLDQEGRVVHTTSFGILRYERTPPAE